MATRIANQLTSRLTQHPVFEQPVLRQCKGGARWCRERIALETWEKRALPELILAGVQRSGSTAVTEALYRLPMVERPRRGKGSHYFSYNYYRGWEWFQSQFPTNLWAKRIGEKHGQPLFCFDACPYYLFHPFAIERMAHALPDVKVLVMLRDPVRRAESHYHHSVSGGHETLSFDEAIEREPERLAGELEKMQDDVSYWSHAHEHYSYVSKGVYVEQLERLFSFYPAKQVKVIFSETFYANPNDVLKEITEWVGLPDVSLKPKDNRNGHAYKKMDLAIRERLVDLYREPNERLFELLGKQADWLGAEKEAHF